MVDGERLAEGIAIGPRTHGPETSSRQRNQESEYLHGVVKSMLTIKPLAGVVLMAVVSIRISMPVVTVALLVLMTAGVPASALELVPESTLMLVDSICAVVPEQALPVAA
jgi:uncharacterized membrane protein